MNHATNLDNYAPDMLRFFVGNTLDQGWLNSTMVNTAEVKQDVSAGDSRVLITAYARLFLPESEDREEATQEHSASLEEFISYGGVITQQGDYLLLEMEASLPDRSYPEDIVPALLENYPELETLLEQRQRLFFKSVLSEIPL